jgi:dihydrolipoamide dehydrogenase
LADKIYDLAIIGSGPAGYTAAIRAGQFGLKSCVIEKEDKLGGTCLHVGCIPTKVLLFSAEIWDHLKSAKELGIEDLGTPKLNWATIQQRKNKIVTKHAKGLEFLMRKHKVETVEGYGRLTGPAKNGVHEVEVYTAGGGGAAGEHTTVKAKKVLLATGSEARMFPGMQPDSRILSNIEILSLTSIPKSLIVVGSGAVGVEFASMYHSFGTECTVLEMLPRIVPLEDEDISKELDRAFRKRNITSHVNAMVKKVDKTQDGVAVTFEIEGKPQTLEAEKVLIAVGRKPRTDNVGLEKTKIKVERGFIHTNEWMETEEPGIYAMGDIVAGAPQLAHVGFMHAKVAVAHIAGRKAKPLGRNRVPACTFCHPEIGSVGMSEAAAKQAGRQVKIGKFPFTANSRASILGAHEGFIKVVSDANFGEILGVHIIGPNAAELIAEAAAAIELEATVEDLMYTVHAHPTLSEAMLDAVESVEGLAIDM